MATRERNLIDYLIKTWAQDQCLDFIISDFEPTPEAMKITQGHLTWAIRENSVNLNLLDLADRIESFLNDKRKRKYPDGMICDKCKNFTQFAESNQQDGSFICFSCINNPYR